MGGAFRGCAWQNGEGSGLGRCWVHSQRRREAGERVWWRLLLILLRGCGRTMLSGDLKKAVRSRVVATRRANSVQKMPMTICSDNLKTGRLWWGGESGGWHRKVRERSAGGMQASAASRWGFVRSSTPSEKGVKHGAKLVDLVGAHFSISGSDSKINITTENTMMSMMMTET